MSLWPCGKCQKQLFIWSNCSQEMWPKDNFGGDLFIQKNLDVVLFLFWSYHKSSGLSLWTVKVDGWWKGIADMDISVESKKMDHEVQKQPLVINNTLETPRMNAKNFISCHFLGEICVFSVIALIFVGNVEWLKELPHWICCYPGAPLERHLCLCKSTATRPERVRNLPPVRRVGWFWVTQHHDRMCQNSAFSKLPKRNGARIHRNSWLWRHFWDAWKKENTFGFSQRI